MEVPFVDLEPQHRAASREFERRLAAVLESTRFTGGPEVEEFEERFADFCGCEHAVGVGNGTDALELALRALGVGSGDRVATAANTFVATVEAIAATGAEPVLVDPQPDTGLITVESLAPLNPEDIDVLVPVHLYGRMTNVKALSAWADRQNVELVEDAAQAHGARTENGRSAGAWGRLGCFSFYPSKNLGAYGDAGAVVTDDAEAARRIRMLGDHGSSPEQDHALPGTNSRLDAVQAAVLNAKLPHLEAWNRERRRLASLYRSKLGDIDQLKLYASDEGTPEKAVYHLFTVEVPASSRSDLRSFLDDRNVGTGVHYPEPVHLTPAFEHLGEGRGTFPAAEKRADRTLSLPMYPGLEPDQVEYVATQLRMFFKHREVPA